MDWISDFVSYTEGVPSPALFREWAGITALAGALERRVWAMTARSPLYPNLYTILVAPPGVGKSIIINIVMDLWRRTGDLAVAPASVTRAGLADNLTAAAKTHVTDDGEVLEYSSLMVCSSEFGNFVPTHDLDFMSILNHVFDNPPIYDEGRRTVENPANVRNPQLTILAGATPSYLGSLIPPEAWAQGFPSRLAMVFAAAGPRVDLFGIQDPRTASRDGLVERLRRVTGLSGQVTWSTGAVGVLEPWYNDGLQPIPTHPKLEHYVPRRILLALKLCIISAVSRGKGLTIAEGDALRAKSWVLDIESRMGDIFKAASASSDGDIMREVHMAMWGAYAKDRAPTSRAALWTWLGNKVPSYRIDSIVEAMIAAGAIAQAGPDNFVPKVWT